MNPTLKHWLRAWILPFFDPRPLVRLTALPRYFREWRDYRARSHERGLHIANLWPCLGDRSSHTPFDPHYFYQGAWLARAVVEKAPTMHVDVGSSVLMLGVLSAAVPTVFIDYRPLASGLPGILPLAANATRLPLTDASVESLSSLHVIEHIGLGRYGDPLDPDGSHKALAEFVRVLRPGGLLYLSVPVGRERVCFNAHRVFSPASIIGALAPLRLESFALVDDAGAFHAQASIAQADRLEYGCGMFALRKERLDRA